MLWPWPPDRVNLTTDLIWPEPTTGLGGRGHPAHRRPCLAARSDRVGISLIL
jgi:hypothetical protein